MEQELFWLQGEPKVYPILRGRRSADAVVVGGGFSGVTTALWLCRAGLKVVLVEAATLGSGASARCAGKICLWSGVSYHQLERQQGRMVASAYGQTQQSAMQSLREWAREHGAKIEWRDTDAYVVAAQEEETLLARELEAMKRAGVTAEMGKATFSPLPAGYALCLKNMATVQPMKYLRSLVREAERLGLKIYEHSRVTALETNLVYTERGSVLAPYLVIATGYPIVNTPGWYFLRLIQKYSYLLPMEEKAQFDGMYLDFHHRYALRHLKSGMLFQLSGFQVGQAKQEDPLQSFERLYAPYLENPRLQRCYAGIETFSPDGLPYLGPYSQKTPNLFVAAGYGGNGLLGSMMAAQTISAKVLGLSNDGDEIYAGRRLSGKSFWLDAKTMLRMGGRYAAGLPRFTAPRCPHLGCKLRYRPRERIWECPCHGSRFDDIGHVINAPATRDAAVRHPRKG